jgi:glycosyltransferase involved in cell wall biosynthesis
VRILHVDKFLRRSGGGATGYMLDLAAAQRGAGHDVEFFSVADEANEPATYEASFAPHVQMEPPPEGVLAKGRAFARTVWSPGAAGAMDDVVEQFRPDVVHLHNIYHQLTPSVLRPLQRRGVPAVMTVHDYKLVCPTYRFLDKQQPCTACLDGRFRHAVQKRCRDGRLGASAAMALEARVHRSTGAYRHVAKLLCPSAFLRDKLEQGGYEPERLLHLPLFVDVVPPSRGPREGVLFTGRLSPEKGLDLLVRAIGQLPDEQLTVVGDGPLRAELEALAEQQAPGRVTFTGHQPKAQVLDRLAAARVAVLPARWYENQPLGVLEAMACGTPMVVTDMGGLPELVQDGLTGVVVPPEDPAALATALRQVRGDAAATMGNAARRVARADFSPTTHLTRVLEVYDGLLDQRSRLP